jgi:hypothetical protein
MGFKMTEQKKRGRKPIGSAPMTAAERKRRQREMMTAAGVRTINVKLSEYTAEVVKRYCEISEVPEAVHLASIAEVALFDWAKDTERRWPEIIERMNSLKQLREERND